jgi:uncharacterized ferritin-like protein (DUF455 family)
MNSVLDTKSVFEKLQLIENECHNLLINPNGIKTPASLHSTPQRDVSVLPRHQLPPKMGLQSAMGQARLLHDLGNIELQAMELGLRTLYNFPDTPPLFRQQLVDVILDEARHLRLCLQGIDKLGFQWGFVPIHTELWGATSSEDNLLDRILIVHCYLEGSGLDASEMILQKLNGVIDKTARKVVNVIAEEEVGHVKFGLNWFQKFCINENLDSSNEFSRRLNDLRIRIPKRMSKINPIARGKAGFNADQIAFLQSY